MESSIDDVKFELKCLQQKYSILQGSFKILEEERSINEKNSQNSHLIEKELFDTHEKLKDTRLLVEYLKNKLKFVYRSLHHEKDAVREMQSAVQRQVTEQQQQLATTIKKIYDAMGNSDDCHTFRIRQLQDERKQFEVYCAQLSKTIDDLKSSMREQEIQHSDEKKKMQDRLQQLIGKVDQLQLMHAHEVGLLRSSLDSFDESKKVLQTEKDLVLDRLIISEDKMKVLGEKFEKSVAESVRLGDINEKLAQECSMWKGKYATIESQSKDANTKLLSQYSKLLEIHEALQSDLHQSREQQERLRSEIKSNSGEKGDMHKKLMSIQKKVRDIESSHEIEMMEWKEKLTSAEEERSRVQLQLSRTEKINCELNKRCSECEADLLTKSEQIISLKEVVSSLESNQLQHDHEMAALKVKIQELTSQCVTIRSSQSESEAQVDILSNKLSTAQQLLQGAVDDRQKLEAELQQKKEDDCKREQAFASSHAALEELQQSVHQTQDVLKAREDEILGLKDTIRRECEERTYMMIKMSELKDQMLRYQAANSVPSSSGAVGSKGASSAVSHNGVHVPSGSSSSYSSSGSSSQAAVTGKRASTLVGSDTPDTDMQPFLKSVVTGIGPPGESRSAGGTGTGTGTGTGSGSGADGSSSSSSSGGGDDKFPTIGSGQGGQGGQGMLAWGGSSATSFDAEGGVAVGREDDGGTAWTQLLARRQKHQQSGGAKGVSAKKHGLPTIGSRSSR